MSPEAVSVSAVLIKPILFNGLSYFSDESSQLQQPAFPSFADAYKTDLPFSVKVPRPQLETEKFQINDSPRNFVRETFARILADDRSSYIVTLLQ